MKGQGFYRRGAGFKVLPQATEGEFRIDLAVVHPSEQRYAMLLESNVMGQPTIRRGRRSRMTFGDRRFEILRLEDLPHLVYRLVA